MATVRKWWARASQSLYDVEMGISSHGSPDTYNVIGIWDAEAAAYYFEFDDTAFVLGHPELSKYDPTEPYSIWDNTDEVVSKIEIGSMKEAIGRETHEAASANIHGVGVGNSVVGTDTTQELKNKTIDDDLNVLQNIAGTALKVDTKVNPVKMRPNVGKDVYLHIRDATDDDMTLKVADDAGTLDKTLKILCRDLELFDDGAAAVKITGVAAPSDADGAVPKSITDELDARITALVAGGSWSGAPVVSMQLNTHHRLISVHFNMVAADNRDEVSRYEIYWNYSGLGAVAAGACDADELALIRSNSSKIMVRTGEGNTAHLNVRHRIYVTVVAFDADGVTYNTTEATMVPEIGDGDMQLGRDGSGGILEANSGNVFGAQVSASVADDNEVGTHLIWKNLATVTAIKQRRKYYHNASIKRLVVTCFGYSTVATGQIDIQIYDEALAKITSMAAVLDIGVGMPTTPLTFSIDVSELSINTVYELRVVLTAGADTGAEAFLRSDIIIEPKSEVRIYG